MQMGSVRTRRWFRDTRKRNIVRPFDTELVATALSEDCVFTTRLPASALSFCFATIVVLLTLSVWPCEAPRVLAGSFSFKCPRFFFSKVLLPDTRVALGLIILTK